MRAAKRARRPLPPRSGRRHETLPPEISCCRGPSYRPSSPPQQHALGGHPSGGQTTRGPSAAPRTLDGMVAPASPALEILHRVFGYEAFRGQQAAIVERVIEGGDALVLMPTGGGKSLCYQIPALVRSGTGVVISPLIALMQDQVDALSAVGVRAAFLNSTQDLDERRRVEAALLAGELDLVYLAPERLKLSSTLDLLDRAPVVAVRDRRGALRVAVGARLPSRLSRALGAARAVAVGSAHRAHGDGDRADPPRDRGAARPRRGRAVRRQLRPAQHPVPHRAQGAAARAAAAADPHRAPRRGRHRLLPVEGLGREDGRRPGRRGDRRPAVPRRSRRGHARPQPVAVPPRRRRRRWWRRSRSAWASTSPTCGSSPTSTCPRASRATTRRPAAPGETACPRPPGSPTACKTWCSSARMIDE